MTLDEYTSMKINSTEDQIIESNSTTLANLPAHVTVIGNSVLKTMQVWALKGESFHHFISGRRRRFPK
jgi:hypothetical protein